MLPARDFRETIHARIRRDHAFREALLREGIDCIRLGDVEAGASVLHEVITALATERGNDVV